MDHFPCQKGNEHRDSAPAWPWWGLFLFPPELCGSRIGGNVSPWHFQSPQSEQTVKVRGRTHPILLPSGYQGSPQHCWAATPRPLYWPPPLFQNIPQEPPTGPQVPKADSSEQGSHAKPGTAAIQHRSGKNQMLGKEESSPCCCSLKGKPRGAAGKSKKAADGQVPRVQVPQQGAKINTRNFEVLPKS